MTLFTGLNPADAPGFTFDGRHSSEFNIYLLRSPVHMMGTRDRYLSTPGRHGDWDLGFDFEGRAIELECFIRATSESELRSRLRDISAWLDPSKGERDLVLDTEPDKTYRVRFAGQVNVEMVARSGRFTLPFRASSPFALGQTLNQQVAGGEITETESTDADWNEAGAVLTRTRADGGDLILADAGTTVQNIIDTQAEWDTGTHNQTRAVADNGGSVELDLAIVGGTTFSETDTTQADWDAGTYDSNSTASTVIFEDFEDTNYVFNFREPSGSEVPWGRYRSSTLVDGESTHRLTYSFKAGSMSSTPLTHKYSRVDFDVNVPAGATDAVLSLWYKVSSEATYDHFRIYVDNFEIRTEGPTGSNDTDAVLEASGNVRWTKWTYPLSPGIHTVRLEYHKDGATDGGQDTAWVDDIQLEYKLPTSDNGVTMDYPYDWDFYDYMGGISPNWSAIGDGVDDSPSGIITITSDAGGADGLERRNVVPNFQDAGFQGFTLDVLSEGPLDISVSDGTQGFTAQTNHSGYKWVRLVIHADRTASWWLDGVLQADHQPLGADSVNRVLLQIVPTVTGTANIHEVYYALKDLGEPGVLGVYTSEVMDISGVSVADASSISWDGSVFAITGQSITVYTRIGTDDGGGSITWDPWQQATNGGSIPGITSGMDLTNKRLQYKIEFLNYEIKRTTNPVVDSVSIDITPLDSAYYSSGTWESGEIDLSSAGVAKDTNILFTGEVPGPGGSILVETNFAPDGVNYLGWKPATNGGSIPDIAPGTNLSTGKLKVRVSFTTDDVHYSPYVSYLELTVTPGYAADGDRIDGGTDVGAIGVAGDSSVEWFADEMAGSTVQVDARTALTGSFVNDMNRDNDGDGVANGFSVNQSGTITVTRSIDTEEDAQKIEAISSGSAGAWASVYREVDVSAGEVYSLGVDVKTGTIEGRFYISWYDDDGPLNQYSTFTYVPPGTDWQTYQISDQVAPAGATKARLYYQVYARNGGETGAVWFKRTYFHQGSTALPFPEWQPCTNGGEIPGIRGTDLTGKTIYFRQRLATSDRTQTPRLLSMTWIIFPETQDPVVANGGTAETFPKITATFNQAAEEITITNLTTGKFAKVERSFTAGDVLVIDCDKGMVEVNGEDERRSFPIESDFFPLVVGENKIAVAPANVAVVDVEWTERWL